ncbi:MAG TPA: hypothetical protein VMF08_14760 [Candidatus Sulfotelmatobacter sp.]|nr:hypothetical protein [Candidatus Sulfotelmatobacter sp.]
MPFFIYNLIGLQVALLIAVVAAWYSMDMRSILKWKQRKAQLTLEGRWYELEKHFENVAKTWRPFVWFHYRYRFPGNFTVQYALFLHSQGRLEEALAKVNLAIQQANGPQPIFWFRRPSDNLTTRCGALRTRVLVLTGLGRYSEARESADQLKKLTGKPEATLALLEYYCGRLDEALVEAETVPREDGQYDTARGVVALAYTTRGEFHRAIEALSEEPGDITKFYTEAGLKTMRASPDGIKLLELRQKKLDGVVQPARFLRLAEAYLGMDDFKNADLVLDQAEMSLGANLAIQGSYCRFRACSLAGQGKGSEVESYIERLGTIAKQRFARSFVYDTHFATGRAYFYLGRFTDALTKLSAAEQSALHPIEKHATAYWIARTYEAAGERDKTIPYYRAVASESIPSWMRKKAAEALAQ